MGMGQGSAIHLDLESPFRPGDRDLAELIKRPERAFYGHLTSTAGIKATGRRVVWR